MTQHRMQTYTGKLVDYLNPTQEQICIEDIAKSLSNECRFGGQTKKHYSVAQHSMHACGLAPHSLKLEALLHDAEEAYIKDIPTPLTAAISRGRVAQYEFIKKKFKIVIRDKFQLVWSETGYDIIKNIDRKLAVTEKNALFNFPQPLYEGENIEPYQMIIFPEPMVIVEEKFLQMFEMYRRDK